MRIHIAKYEPNRQGGGWSFARNFAKVMGQTDYNEADVYFIPSPSMVERAEVEQAKRDGKKIVVRLDNAVRNSRNRNTGMSRMKDFCDWADLVIYQSEWAKSYLMDFTKKDGPVILNGVDLDIFKPPRVFKWNYHSTYLYSRYNRDETKGWEVARYWFSTSAHPTANLIITGNFSPELIDGNFDFYMGEKVQYYGVVGEEQMADLYRQAKYFIYTYFNDACSNSLTEALCSGCKIAGDGYYRKTGGAPEIIKSFREKGREYFSIDRMVGEYRKAIDGVSL